MIFGYIPINYPQVDTTLIYLITFFYHCNSFTSGWIDGRKLFSTFRLEKFIVNEYLRIKEDYYVSSVHSSITWIVSYEFALIGCLLEKKNSDELHAAQDQQIREA